jgi:DNA-binding beta-propeller fold protein YncE
VAAAAGHGPKLWLVRDDGLIIETVGGACPSPWATDGGGTAPLNEPRDIAVSDDGWFALADTRSHRIVWYGPTGACLDIAGSEGADPGSFREPSGLALSDAGVLAVTDTWNGRIQLLKPDGSVEVVGSGLFGPRDALWTAGGSLLVADTGNRRLLRFGPPGWREEVVAELEGLVAVAVPAAGAVAVVDPASGTVVRRLEVPGWSSREQQEGYLARLASGELVATAPAPGELWLLDPTGAEPPRLLRGGLSGVTGIARLPSGELLVSLTWEHRLVKVAIEGSGGERP